MYIYTMINKDNFHMHTNATWIRLKWGAQAYELFQRLQTTCEVIRPVGSTSVYLIDEATGEVYRYADHWGRVASCFWDLDRPLAAWQHPREYVLAKCAFSSFQTKNTCISSSSIPAL